MSAAQKMNEDVELVEYLQQLETATANAEPRRRNAAAFWHTATMALLAGLAESGASSEEAADAWRKRVAALLEHQAAGQFVYPHGEPVPADDEQDFIRDVVWHAYLPVLHETP
jgi:hypothetical protein